MKNDSEITRLTKRIEIIRKSCISDGSVLINEYRWDSDKDLRITSIKRLARLMVGLNASFILLNNSDHEKISDEIQKSFDNNQDINQAILCNELFIKIGFIASLHFVIESVLRDYLRYLDEEKYNKTGGVLKICKCLIEEILEFDNICFDCNALEFLGLIRNTLHNNGVYFPQNKNKKNINIKFNGINYSFYEGKRPNFVSWDLILDITNRLRNLLFQFSNNKKIRSFSGLMLDRNSIF